MAWLGMGRDFPADERISLRLWSADAVVLFDWLMSAEAAASILRDDSNDREVATFPELERGAWDLPLPCPTTQGDAATVQSSPSRNFSIQSLGSVLERRAARRRSSRNR